MSGLKGHRISADIFADMLKLPTGQLVFAARHGQPLRGLTLPAFAIAGGKSWSSTTTTRSMTFDMQEAIDFSNKYHKNQGSNP